jgi:CRISPR-associated exonuclease Cas4
LAHRINLEDNSEDVRIGRVLHELKSENSKNSEISIDNVRIDKLTEDYLVEMKKSDADIEAVKWQTLYYLKVLKSKGIERKGKIEFVEKNKQDKKVIYIDLTEDEEKELMELGNCINTLISQSDAPEVLNKPKCKKCAYYEYCYI